MKSVLCIDDDIVIQTLVLECLKDFEIKAVGTVQQAYDILESQTFDAILLDIQLNDEDGLRILDKVSKKDGFFNNTVLFILSSNKDIAKKMMAFSLGADDFISKPFDPLELEIRLNARLKKISAPLDVRNIGDIAIDFQKQKVFIIRIDKKEDLNLTAIELKILVYITSQLERVFSRQQIINEVWENLTVTERTVDSHIAHLRKKLEGSKISIITSNNFGYFASINLKQ